jgi:DNA helicase-2/ATP-dependent DNA helicase PcrA
LVTAASLSGQATGINPVSPEAFHQGMVVAHPEFGLGKIVAIGGSGPKRSATVQFAGVIGMRKFVLKFSLLRPARG